ncbi:MAG: UbiA family prenyltransferase [Thermoplasmatales archaeon]
MKGYFALMRPVNAVMASLGTLVGGIIARENISALYVPELYMAMIVVFLVLMAGNVLNDYFDADIDKINHPRRPIPSGEVSRHSALILSASLFTFSFIISVFTFNILQILIALLAIFLLVTYEWKTKATGLLGNVVISALVGLIFIYGSLSIGVSVLVLILSLMAFLANLAREIVKDVEDMGGDVNRQTLPKRIGKGLSLMTAVILIIIAVSLSPIPYIFYRWSTLYVLFVGVSDLIFLASAFLSFQNQTAGQNLIKVAMIIGLVAFLVGSSI